MVSEIFGEIVSWILMGMGGGGGGASSRRKHLPPSVSIGVLCALATFVLVGTLVGWIAGLLAAGMVLLVATIIHLRRRQDSHAPRG
jgi:asparagine N-glycosylation enzyme membrane subunit Stt3